MRNLINLVSLMEAYNTDITLSTYKDKLATAITRESRLMTPEQALQAFENADPTPKKAFVLTLLKWYLGGYMRFVEDASKATEALALYSKFRNRPDMPKLSTLSFSELLNLGDELNDKKSKKEENKEDELAFYKNGEAKLYLNNEKWKVVIPKTAEAAIYFGRNTRWCTSAANDNMFEVYTKDGDLYIILEKKTNKRWQFHFESEQFMDEKDEEISAELVKELVNEVGLEKILIPLIGSKNGSLIRFVNNPSEEIKMAAVHQNGYAIKYITNPSEEVQVVSVNTNKFAISYIKNPSEEVQLTAVKKSGCSIQYIKNPSEEVQLAAIEQEAYAITHIKNPSKAAMLAAVNRDGYSIYYIKNPSEEIQLAAIAQNSNAIKYIENPTEKVKKKANQGFVSARYRQ